MAIAGKTAGNPQGQPRRSVRRAGLRGLSAAGRGAAQRTADNPCADDDWLLHAVAGVQRVGNVRIWTPEPEGMFDAFAQAAQRRMLTISCAVYAVLCAVLWAIVGGWLAIPCLLAAILCAWYYRHMSYKQFGGLTGDLAGWFLQGTELVLTVVIIIGGKLL